MSGLDLFAGIGGASLAMQSAGIEVVAHAEIEPFPCKVLEYRFPGVPNLGDVSKITPEQLDALGDVDVISFGSPCQDWSVAGKRLGLKGHRSSLFHEAIRIIRLCSPRFAVFENVPGLFSSAGGWDFAAVLDEMADAGALDIAWRVLDAQWFGVPQRRRRIFLVADFRGERAGEILSISKGVFRHPAPSREAGERVAPTITSGLGNGGQRPADRQAFIPEVAYSLTARNSQDRPEKGAATSVAAHLPGVSFPGNANEGEARDGESETFLPVSFASQNSPEQGDEVVEDGSSPLRSNTTPAVAQPYMVRTHNLHDDVRGDVCQPDIPGSLQATGDTPNQLQAVATNTTGYQGDRVMHPDGTWSALAAQNCNNGGGAGGLLHHGMAVRRLTPTECERLQGFPDGWTDIPGASDSARYRTLGNAWAVPVGAWVMQRLAGIPS